MTDKTDQSNLSPTSHTDRILCTECREEFEDTGMVQAHHCSVCDEIAVSTTDKHSKRRESAAKNMRGIRLT